MKKVVVIGIDGATPDLLESWMNEGKLPHLQNIRENGVWGKLASTIPHHSAPAWTSIVTGCNPGKHGIYGFESTGTLESHLINSSCRRAPAIWNFLTSIGRKSIIINVPGTYPPEKINGVMITGLLTPSPESNFTYPKNIKEKLTKDELGEYRLESIGVEDLPRSYMAKHVPDKLLKQILKQLESRAIVATNLMKKIDWDFTMVVFRGTDTAQHFLFDKKDLLLSCYQKADELVGEMLKMFPDAVFFIVSDHGFGEIKKSLHPANVLYNTGFLRPYQDPYYTTPASIIWYLIFKIGNLSSLVLLSSTFKHSPLVKKLILSKLSKQKVFDFSKTKAFCTSEGYGIQINLKGRYERGIVEKREYKRMCEKIIKLFKDLKDPDTGEKIVEEVYIGSETYGKDAWNPLDLVLSLKKGYGLSEELRLPDGLVSRLQSQSNKLPVLFKYDSSGRTGDHTSKGIFFAYGNNIKANYRVTNLSVVDVTPLALTALCLPMPNNIDGRIHEDIFIEKPTVEKINWELHSTSKNTLSKTEEERIKKLRKKLNI